MTHLPLSLVAVLSSDQPFLPSLSVNSMTDTFTACLALRIEQEEECQSHVLVRWIRWHCTLAEEEVHIAEVDPTGPPLRVPTGLVLCSVGAVRSATDPQRYLRVQQAALTQIRRRLLDVRDRASGAVDIESSDGESGAHSTDNGSGHAARSSRTETETATARGSGGQGGGSRDATAPLPGPATMAKLHAGAGVTQGSDPIPKPAPTANPSGTPKAAPKHQAIAAASTSHQCPQTTCPKRDPPPNPPRPHGSHTEQASEPKRIQPIRTMPAAKRQRQPAKRKAVQFAPAKVPRTGTANFPSLAPPIPSKPAAAAATTVAVENLPPGLEVFSPLQVRWFGRRTAGLVPPSSRSQLAGRDVWIAEYDRASLRLVPWRAWAVPVVGTAKAFGAPDEAALGDRRPGGCEVKLPCLSSALELQAEGLLVVPDQLPPFEAVLLVQRKSPTSANP
eukprot:TRINITY_DN534_c0_g1_i1.p1 TRINITY_DN534_c0_g1~~TRINITY_DN534_c0_g1_i1.p1  ORF type:complete len:447 (-),score=48.22 TRINITY_DN534_c0_g1_i1:115-1455(-)